VSTSDQCADGVVIALQVLKQIGGTFALYHEPSWTCDSQILVSLVRLYEPSHRNPKRAVHSPFFLACASVL